MYIDMAMSVDLKSEYPLYSVPDGVLQIIGRYVIPDLDSKIVSSKGFIGNKAALILVQRLGNLSKWSTLVEKECTALNSRAEIYNATNKIAFWKALPGGIQAIGNSDNIVEQAALLRGWIKENGSKITRLQLSNVKVIPDEIEELKNLRELTIFSSKLIYVSDRITSLPKLKALRIDSQGLKDLPGLGGLSRTLEKLEIRSTNLAKIPDGISDMKNLRRLEVCAPKVPYGKVLQERDKLRKLKLKELSVFLNPDWNVTAEKIGFFERFIPGIIIDSESEIGVENFSSESAMKLQKKR
ncbi:MAG: hypothetical protein ACI9S8_002431 [Chlamydiales bacterium]|jgi:hypothetical protein